MLLIIHVVRSGESLWQIANRYDVNMNSIIQLNGLANPNQLVIGQSLVIPVPGTSHFIKSGESLWSISQQYGVTINSIIEANQLTNPNLLYPGTTLQSRLEYTLFNRGKRYGKSLTVTEQQFKTSLVKIKYKIQILFIQGCS